MSVKDGPQVPRGDGPPQGSGGQIDLLISLTSAKNIHASGLWASGVHDDCRLVAS